MTKSDLPDRTSTRLTGEPSFDATEVDPRLLNLALDSLAAGVFVVDPNRSDYPVVYANRGLERITDYSRGEILGGELGLLDGDVVGNEAAQAVKSAIQERREFRTELLCPRKDGSSSWNLLVLTPLRDSNDNAALVLAEVYDVSELKQATKELQRLRQKLSLHVQHAPLAVIEWDLQQRVAAWNPAAETIFGHTIDEALGRRATDFIVPSSEEAVFEDTWAQLTSGTHHVRTTCKNLTRSGQTIICEWYYTRLETDGKPTGIASLALDITQRARAIEKLRHDAFHDKLTGLPNRALFIERLELAIRRAKRNKLSNFAILFLDLDRFKVINDSMGHLAGDELLVSVSRRLESCLRGGDTLARLEGDHTVARLGGDEFTVLIEDVRTVHDATIVAERIRRKLSEPFELSGRRVVTTASIGIAFSSYEAARPEDLLRDADTAMYRAKAMGKDRFVVFDKSMHRQAVDLLQMESDLREAVDGRRFMLLYQPILNLSNDTVAGFEALIRWRHPTRGLLRPDEFLSLAEETGLIDSIGRWVLQTAAAQLSEWRKASSPGLDLSLTINISEREFQQPELAERLAAILRESDIVPADVRLDIPERAVMEVPASAADQLHRLHGLGFRLALDDFGTVACSLRLLHRLPIDTLKIDRTFVSHMDAAQENFDLVRSVVGLAHSMHMTVTAEGVESAQQLAHLRSMNCELAEGYLISHPVDELTAKKMVAEGGRWQPPEESDTNPDGP